MPNYAVEVASAVGAGTGNTVIDAAVPENIRKANDGGDGTSTFILNVSASAGTPTLDIDVGLNLSGGFAVLGSFAQKTGTGVEVVTIANCPDNCSFDVTIGGTTPSFDYEIVRVYSV